MLSTKMTAKFIGENLLRYLRLQLLARQAVTQNYSGIFFPASDGAKHTAPAV